MPLGGWLVALRQSAVRTPSWWVAVCLTCRPELHLLGRLGASMTVMESYVEHPPLPGLAGVVRTVWVQRTGDVAYVQRHLPTGGVEIRFPIGGHPQLAGPLTGPEIEVIPAHTTILGVKNAYDPHRFFDFPQAI